MKIHGVKREWSHPIFCMKKHYCPHCNEMLEKTKTETIVNSKSEKAKNYDFSQPGGDGYMMGNIKFVRHLRPPEDVPSLGAPPKD